MEITNVLEIPMQGGAMRRFSYLIGLCLLVLVGCGPSSSDATATDGGHMLDRQQRQLEDAKKRVQEMADAAARTAEQVEKTRR